MQKFSGILALENDIVESRMHKLENLQCFKRAKYLKSLNNNFILVEITSFKETDERFEESATCGTAKIAMQQEISFLLIATMLYDERDLYNS